jgi:hypothetical protein
MGMDVYGETPTAGGIIKPGPNWNCLNRIEIRLNPKRRGYDVTIEEADHL